MFTYDLWERKRRFAVATEEPNHPTYNERTGQTCCTKREYKSLSRIAADICASSAVDKATLAEFPVLGVAIVEALRCLSCLGFCGTFGIVFAWIGLADNEDSSSERSLRKIQSNISHSAFLRNHYHEVYHIGWVVGGLVSFSWYNTITVLAISVSCTRASLGANAPGGATHSTTNEGASGNEQCVVLLQPNCLLGET